MKRNNSKYVRIVTIFNFTVTLPVNFFNFPRTANNIRAIGEDNHDFQIKSLCATTYEKVLILMVYFTFHIKNYSDSYGIKYVTKQNGKTSYSCIIY